MAQYRIGTGGWAYFNAQGRSSLKAYSKIFNFVEVNYTFYEYPTQRMVEHWRGSVPKDFTFTVRCHRDLTHRIGLKPVEHAYNVFNQMIQFCRVLEAPFLHLETPRSYSLEKPALEQARDFFSTISLKGVRLAWELRSPITEETSKLMQNFGIVHSVDLSREQPTYGSDTVYTRLFGKGEHNIYQFTDEELVNINQKIAKSEAKTVIASFHGVRMNTDALRFKQYKESGIFPTVTPFVGAESARSVLQEDAVFPSSKQELIKDQGWKIIDLTTEKRVRLSEKLADIPERIYNSLDEVVQTLETSS
ncbi:MAG: DUF72 domain-containing protein [Candidatus Bathyarchaeia archaeon]|jgi:uncharacterized protein YecE (DUF72 family)